MAEKRWDATVRHPADELEEELVRAHDLTRDQIHLLDILHDAGIAHVDEVSEAIEEGESDDS